MSKIKDKFKAKITAVKSFNQVKANEKLAEIKLAKELTDTITTNKGVTMSKKMNKQVKHELARIKLLGQMRAEEQKTVLTEADFTALINEYVEAKKDAGIETKAIEDTAAHPTLLREIQSSDMIFSFDPKSEAGKLLALFTRYDQPVNGKVTLPVDDQNLEAEHLAENEAVTEQTFDETPFELSASRGALNVKISRTLQFKSIIDLLAYIESKINLAIEKALAEGCINGQGSASAQQDTGYGAKKMGKKMPGMRSILSTSSNTLNAANKDLDTTDGKALLQSMFDAAGQEFSSNPSAYVILAPRAEKLKISQLVQGAGVSGVNVSAAPSVYVERYQGVPVVETAFLISRTTTSGSGYSETGFVKTAADNDHGVLILVQAKKMIWHYGGERTDSEYKPSTDSYDITVNFQCGWNMLANARNKPGVMVVNIGADIA